jgi:hypothetical protein
VSIGNQRRTDVSARERPVGADKPVHDERPVQREDVSIPINDILAVQTHSLAAVKRGSETASLIRFRRPSV